MAGSQRNVSVKFTAEIQGFKRAMEEAAQATQKAKAASEAAGKAADKSAADIEKQALAHHAAAKAVGLQYDNTGQLVTMNGKAVSSQQAATHGLQTFSAEAYLAGRAAVAAGEDAEKAAKVAAEAEKKAAEAAKKHKEAVEEVGRVAAIGGAAVVAGVALAVKSYADFDKQMSSVDAATHETAGNMDLLRQAAVDAGADTAFSASEAAQGIEEMAKAGVSTKDILGGGLTGALSLAAAGSLGVGDAAEIAASAMTQFKLSGDKLPHVADLLAAGAGKAQGSVADMGAALNQAGLVAASSGLSIEETTGGLAAFASAGLTGSDAGTSFKSMLQRLTPQSKEAEAKMKELGISAYDAQGNFIGLSKFSENLKTSMKNLTPEARNAAMGVIFGSDAVRAANVLYEQGGKGIEDWTGKVNDAGYAADTAARMQNNLAGDLEKLGGSFDTVLIQSGSGANDVLRGLAQGLEGLVDTVGKVPGPVLGVGTGLAALVGGAALLGGGLITVIPKIQATREAMDLLAPAGSRANAALSRTGKIAAGAATGLAAVAAASAIAQPALDNILKPTGETGDALEAFGGQAAQGAIGADTLSKSFQDLVQHKDGVNDFQQAIVSIADPGVWGNIDNILVGGIKILSFGMADVTSTSDKARERMKAFGTELASLDAETAAKSFQSMARQTDGSEKSLKNLLDFMPDYRKSLEEQAKSAGLATDDQTLLNIALGKVPASTKGAIDGTDALKESIADTGVELGGVISDMDKFLDQLFASGQATISARDAESAYNEALRGIPKVMKDIADSKGKMGRTLNDAATDFDRTTEAGAAANAALEDIALKGMAEVTAKAKEGLGQEELQKTLSTSYEDIKKNADIMGIHGQAADDLARKILGVPPNVNVKTWIEQTAAAQADALKKQLDDLNGRRISVFVDTFKTSFEKRVGLPAQGISDGTYGQGLGVLAPPKATGGIAGYKDGGQLPTSGPGTDTTDGFLGISSAGVPLARVDAGEWIINGRSSSNYSRELAAINAGTFPKLPGYADGGRAYMAQGSAAGAAGGGVTFDFSGAQFTALDPVQLRRDVVDEVTYKINSKSGVRIA